MHLNLFLCFLLWILIRINALLPLTLKTEEECAAFLEDICTIKEIQDISQRLSVAEMLNDGEKYQTIEEKTGASTATISRVNRSLQYGCNGYEEIFKRMEK